MSVLEGVRVVESANFITGPYAGMLLADLGAEVIKVEKPGDGDPFRQFQGGSYSPHFQTYNRNKKSLTLDVTTDAGRAVLGELVDGADVFIENFRPGVAARLGIDARELRRRNPRLVHCSITGFGPDGPYRHRPSYDTVGQALSGSLSLYMDADNPRIPGGVFSDGLTGMYAGYGILGALVERARTGVGRAVETNMLESTMAFMSEPFVNYLGSGEVPGPYRRTRVSQSYAFRCEDGKALIIHLSLPEKFWRSLVTAVGREDLATDARFDTREKRLERYWQLNDVLAEVFATKSRSHWLAALEEHDVPFAPVYTLDEVVDDPQVAHLGTVYQARHPSEGLVRGIRSPVWYDYDRGGDVVAPPTLGQHTDEVLTSIGLSPERIAELRAGGVV